MSKHGLDLAQIAGLLIDAHGGGTAQIVGSEVLSDAQLFAKGGEIVMQGGTADVAFAMELADEGEVLRPGAHVKEPNEIVGHRQGLPVAELGGEAQFAALGVVVLRGQSCGRAAADGEIAAQQNVAAQVGRGGGQKVLAFAVGGGDVARGWGDHARNRAAQIGRGVVEVEFAQQAAELLGPLIARARGAIAVAGDGDDDVAGRQLCRGFATDDLGERLRNLPFVLIDGALVMARFGDGVQERAE